MYPLNGPAWSLFYEYVVNILYGLIVKRFPNWLLTILVALAAGVLIHLTLSSPEGDVIGGWSLAPTQLHIGIARVMYPFFAGLLLFRAAKLVRIQHAFVWCSLLVIILFAMPRIGGKEGPWMNGLYESLSIVFIFPLIIYLGASGELHNKFQVRTCKFLGDISYPIYITHYPLIYWYTGWVYDKHPSVEKAAIAGVMVFLSAITIAYAALKLYDEPVRRWLQKKFLLRKE
jgi:peptidoglycan/LPS O-acetylase OafA/YrhL